MPSFFSNKKLIVLLASLVVLIVLISYSFRQGTKSSWPEQFVQDTVGWFQYVMNVPAQYAAGFFQNVGDISNAYKENQKLKADLADYARVEQENRDITQRYNDLKKLMKIENSADLFDYTKHTALVIGRSYDQWNQIVTVDKGRIDGIRTGMPVVAPGGLIGTVSRTGNFTSEISLISDNQNVNQISAIIQNTKIYGMIEGFDATKGRLLFQKIPLSSNIKKGQIVTTSGLSDMYPAGLLIGTVTSVSTDQYGLTKAAEVKPSANLNDLTSVVIIERKAKTPGSGGTLN
ncbi:MULTISPECIES: rod shape-determining protein MreC [unclassified Sporolactobacillus]|uniref:rod shape-determining protein MreC n=1 Tax=unclassified Sporolactobacillus TaxID=2628533 RepID=UPI0023676F10|nr:rod shape-determining protein MreC [Sporolactobacillus sp. CQH2019]MDD9147695.1 rod shape-determining protein MreC [Sporolactobacillus sp. CQH2019]